MCITKKTTNFKLVPLRAEADDEESESLLRYTIVNIIDSKVFDEFFFFQPGSSMLPQG